MNRTWIFVADKPLSPPQLAALNEHGTAFVKTWTAHDKQLHASFSMLYDRIIVIKVNEDVHEASGCSIDKLTRFMVQMGQLLGVDLLNRLSVVYKKGDAVQVAPVQVIRELIATGEITSETTVFNTAASTEHELENWEQPLKNTWLSKYLQPV
jgi:hypothetical protein